MLLEAEGLTGGYGSSQILFGIDLQIDAGECVSLLGRNGMGKTTTVRACMGLLSGRGGVLRIGGADTADWPAHRVARAGLGLVPEGRQIFPNLTARENLVAAQRDFGAGRGSALEPWTLERVLGLFPALEPRLDAMGNLLSGGEQQMLAIGRALLTNPRLLLLDDATEGLAPRVRDDIWAVLHTLKRAGLAILVIDKHVADLMSLVDRHHVIEKGRLVWTGERAVLERDPGLLERYLGL